MLGFYLIVFLISKVLGWRTGLNASCIFAGPSGYAEIRNRSSSCSDIVISNLTVPGGATLDLRNLANGTSVTFRGETTWEFKEWTGPLLFVSGVNVSVRGAPNSVLNGNGASYWDGKGGGGGRKKPKFFFAHGLVNSNIDGIHILNGPVHVFSISDCQNLTLTNVTIDNSAGEKLGGNTDAFDISSSANITISGARVKNQDDCVAINSGKNITFRDGICIGSHGLSIGSVGGRGDNTVENVLFENSTIVDSQNGVRIKTKQGETGMVSNITYKDIRLENITKYGIIVDQSYGAKDKVPTSGVPITNFTLINITGTVVPGATNIFVNCGNSSSCFRWSWSGISVAGGKNSTKCSSVPTGISC
ncbi:polygalacturonase [Thozetella sp. PMI_491]|nr:polygalacturonase [Thozetella sp. PMI_491]